MNTLRLELLPNRLQNPFSGVGSLSRSTTPGVIGLRPLDNPGALAKARELRKGQKVEIYGGASLVDELNKEGLIHLLSQPETSAGFIRYYPNLNMWIDIRKSEVV